MNRKLSDCHRRIRKRRLRNHLQRGVPGPHGLRDEDECLRLPVTDTTVRCAQVAICFLPVKKKVRAPEHDVCGRRIQSKDIAAQMRYIHRYQCVTPNRQRSMISDPLPGRIILAIAVSCVAYGDALPRECRSGSKPQAASDLVVKKWHGSIVANGSLNTSLPSKAAPNRAIREKVGPYWMVPRFSCPFI